VSTVCRYTPSSSYAMHISLNLTLLSVLNVLCLKHIKFVNNKFINVILFVVETETKKLLNATDFLFHLKGSALINFAFSIIYFHLYWIQIWYGDLATLVAYG